MLLSVVMAGGSGLPGSLLRSGSLAIGRNGLVSRLEFEATEPQAAP